MIVLHMTSLHAPQWCQAAVERDFWAAEEYLGVQELHGSFFMLLLLRMNNASRSP